MDPGVISPQELVQADNVQFSSTGARIKREAFEYLDPAVPVPDVRSSSGTTRSLKFYSEPLVTVATPNQKLVVGERIVVTGNANYEVLDTPITAITSTREETSVVCVADVAGSLNNKYFLISAGDAGTDYYVWFNVNSAGIDPEVAGRTGVEVALATGAANTAVASAVQAAIDALDTFSAGVSTATVEVTAAGPGYAASPDAGNSGFTVSVTLEGGHTISYEVATTLSESATAIPVDTIEVARASAVIAAHDYWRYVSGEVNDQLLVYATDDFQLFTIDGSRRVQILGQEQTTVVVCEAASTITTGDYFLINGANNETSYYVWYNKDSGGGDPALSGSTGVEVAISAADSDAQVAESTWTAFESNTDISVVVAGEELTFTNILAGLTDRSVDVSTGFSVTTTAQGATAPSSPVTRIRMNVFNERLQIYMSGVGNYPIIFHPDENAKYQLMGENLTVIGEDTPTGLSMPDASFAFNHLSRVWTDDKNNHDYLHYSETFDETKWLGIGDSGAIPVNPGDGDPQGINNGYVYKGFVVVGKKASRSRIIGDSPENFQIETISRGIGNEGPIAIPVDESDVVFISKRGIHSQQATDAYGDTDAAYLSADIKPSFNSFDPAQLKAIQGAYIPELNSVAFSIAEDGDQTPNNIWLYNIEAQVPGKDKPGVWYRWPNISCTALSRRLTDGKYKLVFGTVNGRVVQAQREGHYADFDTTGISYLIKTGTIYPGGDPQTMKAFKKISMIYRPRGNFSFAVQAKIDNHEQQSFAFNQTSGLALLGEDFILGTSLLGASNTLAPFTFTMDGIGRGVTLTVTQPTADEQIEIWGFIIEFENIDLIQEVQ